MCASSTASPPSRRSLSTRRPPAATPPCWPACTESVKALAPAVALGALGVVLRRVEGFALDGAVHLAARGQLGRVDEAGRVPEMRAEEGLGALRVGLLDVDEQ